MDVFEAVAEPSRRVLLDLLADGERSAGELVEALPGLSQPAVSRHLRVLREVGLVKVRVDAQRRIYTLHPQALGEVNAWLERYRRFFSAHLDALEQHLSDQHRNTRRRGRDGDTDTDRTDHRGR
jgi:DNA-binding transcriptional ArsR family regulator